MRTEKQREASRTNGAKSNGPVTPEGKAISYKNAYKLGICVNDASFYDDPESRAHINQLLAEYQEFHQPRSPFERDCLEEIALCRVRLARLQRIEEGLFADNRERAFATKSIPGPDGKPLYRFDLNNYPPEERPVVANMHMSAAWRQTNDLFESLTRQETRLTNRLRRAERRFEELLKARNHQHQAAAPAPPPEEKPEMKIEPKPNLNPVDATPDPKTPGTAAPPPLANPDKEAA